MASNLRNLSHDTFSTVNVTDLNLQIGIVQSTYHNNITDKLLEGCEQMLISKGVTNENISIVQVPGAYELISGAQLLHQSNPTLDAIICLGCVITGETPHNDYINHAVAQALGQLNTLHTTNFLFGLLTPNNLEQALARSGGKYGNKGDEAALAALEMSVLKRTLLNSEK